MAALDRFVTEAQFSGASTAWSIGSIPLGDDGRDGRWMRYEEAVADVFSDRPLRAVCLYDATATPLVTRSSVERTHHTLDGRWIDRTNNFVPPVAENLWPVRAPDFALLNPSPREVRAAIDELFAGSVSSDRLQDLRLVGSELASNALVHGTPPTETCIWIEPATCVIRTRDSGAKTIDVFADLRPGHGGAHGGFGLRAVGQLADAVCISNDRRGVTVEACLQLHE